MQPRLAPLSLILVLTTACGDKDDPDAPGGGGDGDSDELVDADGDGIFAGNDCDDEDATTYPGADELCDGVDNDCDDEIDEDAVDAGTWFADTDGDGFGTAGASEVACAAPSGFVDNADDCDDADAAVHPGAPEVCNDIDDDCDDLVDDADDGVDTSTGSTFYADTDDDGYGDAAATVDACVAPSGYRLNSDDCDDTAADINPGATEVCNDIDDDCDGLLDDADDSIDLSTARDWYADTDADGFGDAGNTTLSCAVPSGHVDDATDCDDTDAAINPAATEVCDPDDVDEDCDGASDDADTSVDASTQVLWYADADTDGYGDSSDAGTLYCDDPSDGAATWLTDNTDCDDADAAINPAATEICDAADTDEDCDGDSDDADSSVDLSTGTLWYPDADTDGYGDETDSGTLYCDDPSDGSSTWLTDNTDCDDGAAAVNPAATEVCDAADTDEDCDGDSDDADSSVDLATGTLWYPDADTDGYGDAADSGTLYCDDPSAGAETWLSDNTDCDDTNSAVNPSATEVCDGADTDCDASTSEAGMVTWTDDYTGLMTDATATWAAGSASAPATISATTDGDYAVCGGTWYVQVGVVSAVVGIESPWGTTPAVLDGGAGDSVLTVDSASTLDLVNLTIQNGDANYGGGLHVDGGAAYATDVTFTGNNAITYGGGVYVENSGTISLGDCTVEQNTAGRGAGGFADSFATLTVSTSDVLDNTATTWGGGLEAYDYGTVEVDESLVDGNTAGSFGGGIECNANGTIVVDNSEVTNNDAGVSNGGGIDLYSCDLLIDDSLVDGNAADAGGGGIYVNGSSTATGTGIELANNSSGNGGGLYVAGDSDLTDIDIYGNSASGFGGGVYVTLGSTSASFTSADFSANVGGSLYNAGDSTTYAYGLGETFVCDSSGCY